MVEPLGFLTRYLSDSTALLVTRAIYFVVAFVAVYVVGRLVVRRLVVAALDRRGVDPHAKRPVKRLANLAVVVVALGVAFGAADLGSFLTALGAVAAAATLAVGFATQDLLRNLVAGVFVFTDRPFRIGDWIEWEDYAGVVEDISLRVTRVRTFDNELLTVPNATLTDGVVKNPVAYDRLRLRVEFGIGYGDDVEAAADVLVAEAERLPGVLDDPAPTVRVTELGDSAVGLEARIWVDDPGRADVVRLRGEYVAAVKERFDAAGIDIPYPTRTLTGGIEVESGAEVVEAAESGTRD